MKNGEDVYDNYLYDFYYRITINLIHSETIFYSYELR